MLYNNNNSTDLLNLQGVEIKNVEENEKEIIVHIKMKRKKHICPCCGALTDHVHDYRLQQVKDLDFRGKRTTLLLKKRRYCCPDCGKRFFEENSWLPKYKRRTQRVIVELFGKLKDAVSYKHIAGELHISTTSVLRYFDVVSFTPGELPRVLLIDEFKGNAGNKKYQCILMNGETGKIVDILKDRDTSTLCEYFKDKDTSNVEFLVSDMWKPYRNLCRVFFKNAKHITDKYHVIRTVGWAMEDIRKEFQKTLNRDSRLRYKHTASILRKPYWKLNYEEKERLRIVLNACPKLDQAYELKECFYEIFRCKTQKAANDLLNDWIEEANKSGLKKFIECGKTFNEWRTSILNSVEHPYTNGAIEGMNNKIKVLKRVSYGVRNFGRFRNRIMYTL